MGIRFKEPHAGSNGGASGSLRPVPRPRKEGLSKRVEQLEAQMRSFRKECRNLGVEMPRGGAGPAGCGAAAAARLHGGAGTPPGGQLSRSDSRGRSRGYSQASRHSVRSATPPPATEAPGGVVKRKKPWCSATPVHTDLIPKVGNVTPRRPRSGSAAGIRPSSFSTPPLMVATPTGDASPTFGTPPEGRYHHHHHASFSLEGRSGSGAGGGGAFYSSDASNPHLPPRSGSANASGGTTPRRGRSGSGRRHRGGGAAVELRARQRSGSRGARDYGPPPPEEGFRGPAAVRTVMLDEQHALGYRPGFREASTTSASAPRSSRPPAVWEEPSHADEEVNLMREALRQNGYHVAGCSSASPPPLPSTPPPMIGFGVAPGGGGGGGGAGSARSPPAAAFSLASPEEQFHFREDPHGGAATATAETQTPQRLSAAAGAPSFPETSETTEADGGGGDALRSTHPVLTQPRGVGGAPLGGDLLVFTRQDDSSDDGLCGGAASLRRGSSSVYVKSPPQHVAGSPPLSPSRISMRLWNSGRKSPPSSPLSGSGRKIPPSLAVKSPSKRELPYPFVPPGSPSGSMRSGSGATRGPLPLPPSKSPPTTPRGSGRRSAAGGGGGGGGGADTPDSDALPLASSSHAPMKVPPPRSGGLGN